MKFFQFFVLYLFSLIGISGCNSDDNMPLPDQRDEHVGTYACDVTVENYTTGALLRAYRDTLKITKLGFMQLQVISSRQPAIPLLDILQANTYYGPFTILTIDLDSLNMTSGPDSAHYRYKGIKLE